MPPTRTQLQDKSNKQHASGTSSVPRVSDPYTKAPPLQTTMKHKPHHSTSSKVISHIGTSIRSSSTGPSTVAPSHGHQRSSPTLSLGRSSSAADTVADSTSLASCSGLGTHRNRQTSLVGGIENPIIEQRHIDELKKQGNEAFAASRLVDAFVIFSVCIEEDPREPTYHLNRSLVALHLNLFYISIQDARRATQLIQLRRASGSETTLMPLPPRHAGEEFKVGPITAGVEARWRVLEVKACYREASALYWCKQYEDAATILRQVEAAGSLAEQLRALLQKVTTRTPPPAHIRERRLIADHPRERVAAAKGSNFPSVVFDSKEEYNEAKRRIREAWKRGESVLA